MMGSASPKLRTLFDRHTPLVYAAALLCALAPMSAFAQSENTRVFWQLQYDSELTEAKRAEVQSAVLQTLSRAKERHFASDKIIEQKIRKEGVNFPECFEEGIPCNLGGAFVLDVHNVDAYAKALFSFTGNEWVIDLTLYRSLSSAPSGVRQSGPSLPELFQKVTGSLFEMEAGLDITSQIAGVEVYINQKNIGTTPLSIKIPSGTQSVTFKKTGYVTQTWEFTAEKGEVYSKNVDLVPEVTQLTVLTTAPDARVLIDGQEWGASNETNDILPGNHTIEITSETHHPFTQDYRVYPGPPQTLQVAMLPNSASHWDIRHQGISKYRFSTSLGYHLGVHALNMPDARKEGLRPFFSESAVFHGVSWVLSYEAEYWGISIFRFDIGSASPGKTFHLDDISVASPSGALLVSLYPAMLKAHYTFWVMQAEASFGVGLSYLKLNASGSTFGDFSLSQTAFSIDFSLGLKYFFSEESFAMISYDLQYDATHRSKPRNGVTFSLGIQIPLWMRSTQPVQQDDDLIELQENPHETEPADPPVNPSQEEG